MLFHFFAISESKSRAKYKGDQPLFDQSPVFFDECFASYLLQEKCMLFLRSSAMAWHKVALTLAVNIRNTSQ